MDSRIERKYIEEVIACARRLDEKGMPFCES